MNDNKDPVTIDSAFNLKFVKRLLEDSETLEIEIPADSFDCAKLKQDIEHYYVWKSKAENVLKKLE